MSTLSEAIQDLNLTIADIETLQLSMPHDSLIPAAVQALPGVQESLVKSKYTQGNELRRALQQLKAARASLVRANI